MIIIAIYFLTSVSIMLFNKTLNNALASVYRELKEETTKNISPIEKYINFLILISIVMLFLLLWPFFTVFLIADYKEKKQKEKKEIDEHKKNIESLMKEIIDE